MPDSLLQHVPDLFRYALTLSRNVHAAEDLVQDTLVRSLSVVRSQEVSLPEGGDATRKWLLRILYHRWIDVQRAKQTQQRSLEEAHQPVHVDDPGQRASLVEEADQALQAILQLPDRQRAVLYLVAVVGMTPTEVAETLELPHGAVRSSLSLARARVRSIMNTPSSSNHATISINPPRP